MRTRETGPIDRAARTPVSDAFKARYDAVDVGARLREARILLRQSLPDVARGLRIRHAHLLAIEEGRLEDLPGLAYQTGFLRAYGNYLGLDGARLAEELKEARDATGEQDPLQVFSPIDEGHLPTRSILLLAALLAIVVYGVWYFVSNTDGDPVERVAALPDRLAGLLDDEPDDENPSRVAAAPDTASSPAPPPPEPTSRDENEENDETVETVSAAPEPSTPPAVPDSTPPPAEPAPEASRPVSADETSPAEPNAEPPAAERAAEAPLTEPASAPPSEQPIAEPPVVASINATAPPAEHDRPETPPVPEENDADPPGETIETPLPAPAPAAAEDLGTTPETPSTDIGEETAVSRIVLRAETDSWIEIRTNDASLVYSGLLREGQRYSVPERPGLRMVTGNAGGLEVLVDGQAIARLGPPGSVIRDVDLDPESLLGRDGR